MGVGIEGGPDGVGTAGLVEGIVDEKPHLDTAIRRPDHAVDDDPPGFVVPVPPAPALVLEEPGISGDALAEQVETVVGQVRGIGHWHAVELTADRHKKAPPADGTVAAGNLRAG